MGKLVAGNFILEIGPDDQMVLISSVVTGLQLSGHFFPL